MAVAPRGFVYLAGHLGTAYGRELVMRSAGLSLPRLRIDANRSAASR